MKTSAQRLTCVAGVILLAVACVESNKTRVTETSLDSIPSFIVDPFWPKSLPKNWIIGQVGGVAVDSKDHVWIIHRPKSLGKEETDATPFPPAEFSLFPAPPVIEFDSDGNVVRAWGGPNKDYEWAESFEHGIFIDHEDNVWINGGGPEGHQVFKFRPDGTLLLQIGQAPKKINTEKIVPITSPSAMSTDTLLGPNSNDTIHLGAPTDFAVDRVSNEVYIADGYRNHRIAVFNAHNGKYKRHWGAYGKMPNDNLGQYNPGYPPSDHNPPDPDRPPVQQFTTVHGVGISNDGKVYACDRSNNRIQVFERNGKFLEETFIAKETLGYGSVWDVAFSHDPEQSFIYVSDGTNNCVWILKRKTLKVAGKFGRLGRYAGQFIGLHNVAVDSKGNIYTSEVFTGKRVQKFILSDNSVKKK